MDSIECKDGRGDICCTLENGQYKCLVQIIRSGGRNHCFPQGAEWHAAGFPPFPGLYPWKDPNGRRCEYSGCRIPHYRECRKYHPIADWRFFDQRRVASKAPPSFPGLCYRNSQSAYGRHLQYPLPSAGKNRRNGYRVLFLPVRHWQENPKWDMLQTMPV